MARRNLAFAAKQTAVATQSQPDSAKPWPTWLAYFVLVLLATLPFSPALPGGFLWDDVSLHENLLVRSPSGLLAIWFDPRLNQWEDHYWPLTYTTFWLEWQIWGDWPPGFRATNIALHALCAVLVWRALILTKLPPIVSLFAAAFFAVHPLRVESVAWIIERKDVLSGALALGSAVTYLSATDVPRWGRVAVATALYLCALLAKSSPAFWPVALLLAVSWRDRKWSKAHVLRCAMMLACGLCVIVGDLIYLKSPGGEDVSYTVVERIPIAGAAFWHYIIKTVAPWPLMPLYPLVGLGSSAWMGWVGVAFGAVVAVAVTVGWIRRHAKLTEAAYVMVAYLFLIGPVLGLVLHGFMRMSFVADRFTYLAQIPLLVGAAGLLFGLSQPIKAWQKAAASGVVVALCGITLFQASLHRDPLRFWQWAAARNPQAYEAFHHMGIEFGKRGDYPKSIEALSRSIELLPGYPEAHNNLATAYLMMGQLDEALANFQIAYRNRPAYAQAANGIGTVLAQRGELRQALKFFEEAVQLNPALEDAAANLEKVRRDLGLAPQ